ncbi:MAG: metal-sensing transcriptional repressor [Pseudonocardiaceae bacterium]
MDIHQHSIVNRLKTARGHMSGIISIIEDDAYCPDVMSSSRRFRGC